MDEPKEEERSSEKGPSPDRGADQKQGDSTGPPALAGQEPKESLGRRVTLFGLSVSREIFVLVAAGLIVAAAGVGTIVVVTSGKGEEEPAVPTPPLSIQAKDNAVPDAKGPVKEQVWVQTGATTFSNPYNFSGAELKVPYDQYVKVSCKLYWPHPRSVAEDGFWYRIITKPWKGSFSPANLYWNGDKPGRKPAHSTDFHVRDCHAGELPGT
jgi:hypothetical protein